MKSVKKILCLILTLAIVGLCSFQELYAAEITDTALPTALEASSKTIDYTVKLYNPNGVQAGIVKYRVVASYSSVERWAKIESVTVLERSALQENTTITTHRKGTYAQNSQVVYGIFVNNLSEQTITWTIYTNGRLTCEAFDYYGNPLTVTAKNVV